MLGKLAVRERCNRRKSWYKKVLASLDCIGRSGNLFAESLDWLAGLVTCLLLWCGGHGENHRGRLGAELTGVGLKMAMGTRDPIPDGYLLY